MTRTCILWITLSLLVGCAQNISYYQSITFDNKYNIVGTGKLHNLPKKGGVYTIWYDKWKRPIRIIYSITNTLHEDPFFNVAEIRFEYTNNQEKRFFLDKDGRLMMSPQQKFAVAILLYNDKGQAYEVHYYDTNLAPTPDFRGAFFYRWIRDSHNRITKLTGYNTNNQKVSFMGIASIEMVYDHKGNIVESRYYDTNDNLSSKNFFGYAIERQTYDQKGRLVEKTFYDEKAQPANYNFWNVHKYRYLYNKKGKLTNTLRYRITTNGEITLIER